MKKSEGLEAFENMVLSVIIGAAILVCGYVAFFGFIACYHIFLNVPVGM